MDPSKHTLYQDMTQPLSHYWCASSHNTYLEGDQVRGKVWAGREGDGEGSASEGGGSRAGNPSENPSRLSPPTVPRDCSPRLFPRLDPPHF